MNHDNPAAAISEDDPRVDKLAAKLYAIQVRGVIERARNVTYDVPHISQVLALARDESDRSAVILVSSLIEDIMREGFERFLVSDTKGDVKSLLDNNGPLATSNNRINLLRALSWIGPVTSRNLHAIRKTRNIFAHSVAVHSLSADKVRDIVGSLEPQVEEGAASLANLPPRKMSSREIFLMRAAHAVQQLTFNLAFFPLASRSQVAPESISPEFADLPENLRLVSIAIAGHFIEVLQGAGRRT